MSVCTVLISTHSHCRPHPLQAADNILFGSKELTLNYPDIVNAKKNMELLYSRS